MSKREYNQYWKSMTDFRNKYAAHRELNFINPVPNFDTALKVAFFYDQWVRKVIFPATIDEPPLESFAQSLEESAVPFVEKLMD
jgi:hypothetical protein